jgi:hypothetical protein
VALKGDPAVVVAGTHRDGIVFVDTTLRLAGDTTILADEVYVGPNARLSTCWAPNGTPDDNDDGCANGRSLAIHAAGAVSIAAGIDLTGGSGGPTAHGGNLVLSGASIAVPGTVVTAGRGAPSGGVLLVASGRLVPAGRLPLADVIAEWLRTDPREVLPDLPAGDLNRYDGTHALLKAA